MNFLVSMMLWAAASLGVPGIDYDPKTEDTCETSQNTSDGASGPPPSCEGRGGTDSGMEMHF